jgi:hypothetical protein
MSVVERLLLVIVFIVGGMLGDQAPGDDLFVVRCEVKNVLLIDVTFDTSNALHDDIKSRLALPLLEKVCYVFVPKKYFAAQLVLLLQCVDG